MPNLVTDAFITENTIKGRRILHYLGNANGIRFRIRRDAYYLIMLGLPWGKATVSIDNLNQAIEIGGVTSVKYSSVYQSRQSRIY